MFSSATIAGLVFGACGLLAAAAVEYLLRSFAEEAGVNRWIFVAVPGLFAMLYAMFLYQNAHRKVRRLGESVSRGILIALLTWISFSLLASWAWCSPRQMGACLGNTLLISGIVGGGPMLAAAFLAGVLTGLLVIRPPRKPRE
jgi:uncharacterized membrane protein